MKTERQERADRLSEMLDSLGSVMADTRVMESPNAATIFRKLLAVQRWLGRDFTAVTPMDARLSVTEEVAPANYRLHQQDEIASEPVISAEIVGIGARHGAMTVFARFPGRAELAGVSEFVVGFEDDDQRLEIVEFLRVDPATGAPMDVPPGAFAGLYAALIATCRDELDQWRISVAELEGTALEPAKSPEPPAKSLRTYSASATTDSDLAAPVLRPSKCAGLSRHPPRQKRSRIRSRRGIHSSVIPL
jgi:hypothetical protein